MNPEKDDKFLPMNEAFAAQVAGYQAELERWNRRVTAFLFPGLGILFFLWLVCRRWVPGDSWVWWVFLVLLFGGLFGLAGLLICAQRRGARRLGLRCTGCRNAPLPSMLGLVAATGNCPWCGAAYRGTKGDEAREARSRKIVDCRRRMTALQGGLVAGMFVALGGICGVMFFLERRVFHGAEAPDWVAGLMLVALAGGAAGLYAIWRLFMRRWQAEGVGCDGCGKLPGDQAMRIIATTGNCPSCGGVFCAGAGGERKAEASLVAEIRGCRRSMAWKGVAFGIVYLGYLVFAGRFLKEAFSRLTTLVAIGAAFSGRDWVGVGVLAVMVLILLAAPILLMRHLGRLLRRRGLSCGSCGWCPELGGGLDFVAATGKCPKCGGRFRGEG